MSVGHYPSVEYIKQLFRYEDGKLFWLKRPRDHFVSDHACNAWNAKSAGKEAGNLFHPTNGGPRWKIRFTGGDTKYETYRHIVIWAIFDRGWADCLDHKDRGSLYYPVGNLK